MTSADPGEECEPHNDFRINVCIYVCVCTYIYIYILCVCVCAYNIYILYIKPPQSILNDLHQLVKRDKRLN